jgi:molybdopterin molybdotransferase
MKPVSEALDLILSHATLTPAETVPLQVALHRVLREAATADLDSPPFDCSSMDGYALRAQDAGTPLEIVAEIQAGGATPPAIGANQCARIFTGAQIPAGADCVLMQEEAIIEQGRLLAPEIELSENIRKQGENCRRGDIIVKSGATLRAEDLASLASCGIMQPLVSSRPRVIHFVTGDELIDPTRTPVGSQIRDSNSTLIASLLASHGAVLMHHARIPDDFETSAQLLAAQNDFDLLLISGGASVGDYDFARPLLEKAGFEILLHKINMRPGKPLIFAVRGSQLAFGIPGNPVSHAVIFHLMLAPLLAAMTGAQRSRELFQGHLENDFSPRPNPRETYWPCRATWREGAFRLRPLRFQSSGDISGLAGMNALLRIPSNHDSPIKQSDLADFLWLESTL